MLSLDHLKSADPASDVDAEVLGLFLRNLQVRRLYGKLGRSHPELNEATHLLHVFFVDVGERIEVFHFTRDARCETCGVELRDRTDTALAAFDGRPVLFSTRTDRTDE